MSNHFYHLFLTASRTYSLLPFYKYWIVIFLFSITSLPAIAQDMVITDTVEYAKEKAYEKDFSEADKVLTAYNSSNSNIQALRLHSQVLFWMKDFDRSIATQQQALAAFPEENQLKLEYGSRLFDMGRYKLSEKVLQDFLIYDSLNVEALNKLAQINLWKGRNERTKLYTTRILQKEPDNTKAVAILKLLQNYTSPYIQVNVGAFSDDQPINGNFQEIMGGWYHSWILSPVISLKHNTATASNTSYRSNWIQLMNSINLNMGKTKILFKGGIFNQYEPVTTGAVYIRQKVSGNLSFIAGGEKRPYQYTMASVKQPLLQNFYTLSMDFNNKDKWLGKAAYEMQQFADNNRVHTSYIWMLLPILHKDNFSFKGGYSFNYSTSLFNKFILKDSSSSISNIPFTNKQLEGVYAPYFTPQNQIVHSLLASVTINPSETFFLTLRGSVGVNAKADAPSFSVKQQTNQYSVSKTYNVLSYTPVEAVAEMKIVVSHLFSINTAYTYNSLFFYTSHTGVIGLKYSFNP